MNHLENINLKNLFSAKGRMRRRQFATIGIPLYIIGSILLLIPFEIIFLPSLLFLIVFFIQAIKRCHDFNASGWVSLIILLPFIGMLYLLLTPGTPGVNGFGEDPKNGGKRINLDDL